MARIVIGYSLADAAAITAGSEADEMPATRLQTMQPSEKWRAVALGSAFVEIDLGAATLVTLAALLATNATSAATWRIRAAASQANLTAAPDYDSTALAFAVDGALDATRRAAGQVHGVKWLGAAGETRRWWRIDLIDAANPDGFLEAGRLVLANAWQPATNYQFGGSFEPVDGATQETSMGGQTYPSGGASRRIARLPLVFTAVADHRALIDLARLRGTMRDVLVVLDPAAPSFETMLHGLARTWSPVENTHHRWWQCAPEFVELI